MKSLGTQLTGEAFGRKRPLLSILEAYLICLLDKLPFSCTGLVASWENLEDIYVFSIFPLILFYKTWSCTHTKTETASVKIPEFFVLSSLQKHMAHALTETCSNKMKY